MSTQPASVQFVIPGDPCAKQRPRMTRTGHAYTPTKTVSYENLVKTIYTDKCGKCFEGPVSINIYAYFSIPKSVSKKKREEMLNGHILPTKKPDWDNIGKIITDSLNSIAYEDDKQVVSAKVIKLYGVVPRVEVIISEALQERGNYLD